MGKCELYPISLCEKFLSYRVQLFVTNNLGPFLLEFDKWNGRKMAYNAEIESVPSKITSDIHHKNPHLGHF